MLLGVVLVVQTGADVFRLVNEAERYVPSSTGVDSVSCWRTIQPLQDQMRTKLSDTDLANLATAGKWLARR